MNIIQQPDALSLSQNLKEFLITSDVQVSFVLRQGADIILTQQYEPPTEGYITIDLKDIVHGRLSYDLKDTGDIYQQFSLVADFTAIIDSTEVSFRAIRCGVDRLSDSATNFLTQNFLTWQPSVKPVTYYSPEFLTYYAVIASTAKLRAYFTDESGVISSQTDYTISDLLPGIAYTIPLQYSVVAGWLGHQLPAYYDVWIENSSGKRLTYIQRYYAEDMRSEQEQWVLFENSLGGLDTFRAYGTTTFNGDHTHNLVEIEEVSQEYRVDTERKFQKNTGHLNKDERKWLLDFFPSQGKYIYTDSYLRRIVVTDSNVSYSDRDLPSSYTFTFKYADARPLLNLPRTDVPAEVLNITVPNVGSFSLPPRLAEFSRLSLSEGALFPVQNPYSEQWSTTTVDAIGYFLADFMSRVYGSGGNVGHKHRNYDLLELLSYIENYLLVNGQKIKAGYADKAGSVDGIEDIFLHKNKADGTPFPMTFGDLVKFGEFITGISGGCIDKNGILEMEEGIFRKRLFVPEIAYNRVTYFKGRMCASPGGGCTVKEWSDNGDGSYTIIPDLTDADGLSQFVDDILSTYFVTKSPEGKLQGFEEMKFRVTAADYEKKTFVMVPKPDTTWKPGDSMVLAQTGNFTDPDRQTYILIDTINGNNCITFYDHANTWDVEPAQEPSWFGKKKGRTVHGIPADNYSAVLRNIIMSGKIFQVDDITGEAFRVPLNKGAWKSSVKNAYYDEVTHNGSSWLCVNPNGTTSEPSDTNSDWLKCVSKGDKGDQGAQGLQGLQGDKGEQGIQGPKGADGLPTYFHIKYAPIQNPTASQMTEIPDVFIGTYVDNIATDSSDPNKYTWARFQGIQGATGEKGIPGINGSNGQTSYLHIKYSDNGTSFTSNNGETPGQWIGQYTDFTEADSSIFSRYTWTKIKGDKGDQGTSIASCGDWHTGLHVPYMGLTKMANRVFLCKNPAGTDNPPMWTITTKDGNRILQTQDGGKTYRYILTGELNTAEYELLVENGQDGRDGKDYEWIFKNTTENVVPPTPGTSQTDDYVPSGWNDDPIGVSESLPYEWACCRTKKDGVWSAFSPAALWAKFGFDGESVILADIDNEMESIALTYEGKTTAAAVLNTTVGMWYGTEKLQLKSISCVTPAGVTESYNINTGVIAFSVASGISMPARSQVSITITATVQGTDISRELVFTIAGVRAGNPGSDAVLYRLVPSVSSVSKKKDGTYSVASVSCTRTKSVGNSTAITTDGALKYSKDGGSETTIQNGTEISPKNFSKQLQFVYYINDQVVDRETIPMLADGTDGTGIKSTDVEYAISNSNAIAPTAGWQTTSPAWEDGKYIWSRTKIVYTDSNVTYSDPACITGGKGGDGKGIKSIVEEYYLSSSSAATTGGSWQTTSPAWKNGWYIWTRTKITYTDNTTTTTNAICVTGGIGSSGNDGISVKAGGEWKTANTPVDALTICTMGGSAWLSKVRTSNPPMWTVTDSQDRRILQTQDGGKTYGYIPTGAINTAEWELLTSDGGMVYLISTCSNIRASNAGSLVPSAFRVYAKKTLGSATLTHSDGYLAARGYSNGIWTSVAGPSRASEITVNAAAGYSTFSVRCYQNQTDASAWNDSFIAEMSVGVSYDGLQGEDGRTGSEPRPRGLFVKGNTYVWNDQFHDIVLATFNNRTIPFRVRAYGTSVTVAPSSIDGDANWESAQQFQFVATDLLLSRQIRADEIYTDNLVVQNVLAKDAAGKPMCQIDGKNGGIGFLAGGNIRWDATGNVFQDASLYRKLKILSNINGQYEYYLDFNSGLNFEISQIISSPTREYTIYLPNAADYEGGECMLYNGAVYSRLGGPASIKVADGGSFIMDGEYHTRICVPSLSLAQFKAVATSSDGVKDGVKWVLISGKAESIT